jgi:Family of unknown function (DUF6289)
MPLSKRVLRMFALALALAAASFSMKSTETAEAANLLIACDYYSDATHTVLVGAYVRVCNGHINSWGTVTPYKVCSSEPCG